MPGFYTNDYATIKTGPGSIYDYEAGSYENFAASIDTLMLNPAAYVGRQARFLSERLDGIAGTTEMVDQKTADEENRKLGLDLKTPVGGVSRYELNWLQRLKQDEIKKQTISARTHSVSGFAAGLAGSLLAGSVDPINIASSFIPIVPEARYAAWLANAGTSTAGRIGARAFAGAAEGAVGAALIEPITYLGAQAEQADYGAADSFLNVVFGGALGGGLHVAGGALHDASVSKALRGLDEGIRALAAREAAANAPESVHLAALESSVRALENDAPPNAAEVFRAAEPVERELPPVRALDQTAGVDGSFRVGLVDEFKQKLETAATPADRAFVLSDLLRYPEASIKQIVAALPDLFPDVKSAHEKVAQAAVKLEDGQVFTGTSHADAIEKAAAKTGESVDAIAEVAGDGFVTDAGRYVDRAEAKKLADGTEGGALVSSRIGVGETKAALKAVIEAERAKAAESPAPQEGQPSPARESGEEADLQTMKAAEEAATKPETTLEDIHAELDDANTHLGSLRERGLLRPEDEARLAEADLAAERAELEAQAVEAAAICEMGAA